MFLPIFPVHLVPKAVLQSSTATYDGLEAVAELAVDGNKNTDWYTDRTCMHTEFETNPWWAADLGG